MTLCGTRRVLPARDAWALLFVGRKKVKGTIAIDCASLLLCVVDGYLS